MINPRETMLKAMTLSGRPVRRRRGYLPGRTDFVMAGRQAQGTWNAAVFSGADGNLVHSVDTKKRITHALFTADGQSLIISGANGQPQRKDGEWPPWGRLQIYRIEA